MGSRAHNWCRANDLYDGDDWRGVEAAVRHELDTNDDASVCRWALIGPEGDREEFPSIVWLSDCSGIVMTEAWWDVVAHGTTPAVEKGGRVVGPL